jgi:N-acetylglucosamine kinase-like BadF-type ATPase
MTNETEIKDHSRKYFAGIDGGGTKTNVSVLDQEGKLVFTKTFGPSNLLNGTEFEESIGSMFKALIAALKDQTRDKILLNIYAGFAGTSSNEPESRFRAAGKRSLLGHDITLGSVTVISDALLALNVYYPHKPGLLLISGTGSICYGKDESGEIFRTGGFGYLIDDHGSGYWFGKEAVRAALYSKFHYGEKSILEEMVFRHFSVSDPSEIYDLIYKNNSKMLIASASELVFNARKEGCPAADKIIHKGADELVYLVQNCSKLIGGKSPCVVLHGSVFKQEQLVEMVRKKLIEYMNVYISDKRIDLEAANQLYENFLNQKDL